MPTAQLQEKRGQPRGGFQSRPLFIYVLNISQIRNAYQDLSLWSTLLETPVHLIIYAVNQSANQATCNILCPY